MSTRESGFKRLRIRLPDSRDTSMEAKSQRKKLQIQQYPDTCRRSLRVILPLMKPVSCFKPAEDFLGKKCNNISLQPK